MSDDKDKVIEVLITQKNYWREKANMYEDFILKNIKNFKGTINLDGGKIDFEINEEEHERR